MQPLEISFASYIEMFGSVSPVQNMNQPSPRTTRLLDQARFESAAEAAGLERVVFLAGPFIDTAKRPRKSKGNRAALLRYELFHILDREGWIVTLGEYQKLIDAAEPALGEHNNAALAEIKHARDKSTDAIVMLPSSPGSFLELGAFASINDICTKMLIIVDKQYEAHTNYMNTGPLKSAAIKHATLKFIDYSDIEACAKEVEQFVTSRIWVRMEKEILAP
ncbi:hypothetical protein [Thalassospira sp.]|uniref:hypothetical protein n=1 Tax=Thalassospira sp. TaxID=1912094 RepID=UPI00311D7372